MYGDFEDLETGEMHTGKVSDDDDNADEKSDADAAGTDKKESEFINPRLVISWTQLFDSLIV